MPASLAARFDLLSSWSVGICEGCTMTASPLGLHKLKGFMIWFLNGYMSLRCRCARHVDCACDAR